MLLDQETKQGHLSPRKHTLFRDHPLFQRLEPELIDQLNSHFVKKNIARGTAIFAVCDAAASVFAVCAGTVKISTSTADGRDVVFNLVNAGEIFGEIAVLDGGTRTADATAMTDCELVEIQGRDFLTIARKRPELGLKLLELLCRRLRRTSEQLEDMMGLGLPRRLAKTLLRLTEGIAPSVHGRKVAFTHREIGQMVGASRESTNKYLRGWQRRGWVHLDRASIVVLAPRALAAFATAGDRFWFPVGPGDRAGPYG